MSITIMSSSHPNDLIMATSHHGYKIHLNDGAIINSSHLKSSHP